MLCIACFVFDDVDDAENNHELLHGGEDGADYDVGHSSSIISVSTPESLRFSSTYCLTLIYST